jgi:FkbM family methyltransferase
VKETLVDDVYGLQAHEIKGGVVVDVGAGIGEFALAAARRFPQARIISYEPNPKTYRLLESNMRQNSVANVQIVRLAIGTQESYVLRRASRGPRASAALLGADEDAVVVPARRLDDELGDAWISLLKIDCEGLEADVLESATSVLRRVERVVVEYHRWLLADADRLVADFLSRQGFTTSVRHDAYDVRLGYVDARRDSIESVVA